MAKKARKSAAVKGLSNQSAGSRRLAAIERRLKAEYGNPRHHNPEDPLDDLILLVLSRMTQETKYLRTYHAMRDRFPSWDCVRDAPASAVQRVIADAGLAPTKSAHIQAILKEIQHREGALDLGRLRTLTDEEVEAYLISLPGVSRKTARCVMLYALGRAIPAPWILTCGASCSGWEWLAKALGLSAVRLRWKNGSHGASGVHFT